MKKFIARWMRQQANRLDPQPPKQRMVGWVVQEGRTTTTAGPGPLNYTFHP